MRMGTSLETLLEVPLSIILNKLEGKDAKNCRLVNRHLKGKIEQLYENWILKCTKDTEMTHIAPLLNLKIKQVKLSNFSARLPRQPSGGILKYPGRLQSLQCGDERKCDLAKEVHPEDLEILLKASKLRELKLRLAPQLVADLHLSTSTYTFPQLRSLYIGTWFSEKEDSSEPPRLDSFNSFYRLLAQPLAPNVTSISLGLDGYIDEASVKRLTEALFLFLERNGPILKHLEYTSLRPPTVQELPSYGFAKTCKTLDSLRLGTSDCDFAIHSSQAWKRLIQSQTMLGFLQINSNHSLSSFQTLILPHIRRTLTGIQLLSLVVDEEVLDMSAFQACPNLLKLRLTTANEAEEKRVMDLNSLPKALEELDMTFFQILDEEMVDFCSARPRLTTLRLGYTEDLVVEEGTPCLTGRVLSRLMNTTYLTHLEFRYGWVRQGVEDKEALEEICRAMGQEDIGVFIINVGVTSRDDEGFKLVRETVGSQWRLMRPVLD